ncbi:hypothetical protein L596_022163 [Steinernema carpocapsae]|uniref:Uncharacterized protein n=1 Tax=Steinernema carpocapsae TaxID=34508 RepID=A0A4U5MKW7_STECR|nr:hypothetical protein L596_022163 [Steinernema carpocapsae]
MKPKNAFMVLGQIQLLTVIDTINLVNQSFKIPLDQKPDYETEYDHLTVDCSMGEFSEEVLEDAARKAIDKVAISLIRSLNLSRNWALFSAFAHSLTCIELSEGSYQHADPINGFLRSQLVNEKLSILSLKNCPCKMTTLEEEVVKFLWKRLDTQLRIDLDEPTEEECLGFDVLNTFIEMTYTHQKNRKKAEIYLKCSEQEAWKEIGNRAYPKDVLKIQVEEVNMDFCKLCLSYESGR